MTSYIGIDLGTTNSCMAIFEPVTKEVTVVPNEENNLTTPSIVRYNTENNEITVGEKAKQVQHLFPNEICSEHKRVITKPINFIVHDKNTEIVAQFSPHEISAEILKYLKKQIENYTTSNVFYDSQVVITIPAYFTEKHRALVKEAARLANMKNVILLNEPTAAAIAFGLQEKPENVSSQNILVYDLGGSTFDVSIININYHNNDIQVLTTMGDNELGGMDIDNKLYDVIIEEVKNKIVNYEDGLVISRLKKEIEKAKIALSNQQEYLIQLNYLGLDINNNPVNFEYLLDRRELEFLALDLIRKTINITFEAIENSQLNIKNIDSVLLIGGQTKMPLIQEELYSIFGNKIKKQAEPDFAVAKGAAIHAFLKQKETFKLIEVTPLNLGIQIRNSITQIIIPKDSKLPIKKSVIVHPTKPMQNATDLVILQGNSFNSHSNEMLASIQLEIVNPKIDFQNVQIEVTFELNEEGVLTVTASELTSNNGNNVKTINIHNLYHEKMQKNDIEHYEKQDNDMLITELTNFDKHISDMRNKYQELFNSSQNIEIFYQHIKRQIYIDFPLAKQLWNKLEKQLVQYKI